MLILNVVNSAGRTDLYAFIEKVDNDGVQLDPRIVWSNDADAFEEYDAQPLSDLGVPLTEDSLIPGNYSAQISDINEEAENLAIVVYVDDGSDVYAIGQSINLPGAVTPEVVVQLEVNEDRS